MVGDFGVFFGGAVGGFEGVDFFAAFGHVEPGFEHGGVAVVGEDVPELVFLPGEGAGEAGDGFDLEGDAGGELGEAFGVGFVVDEAFADGGPLDDGAVFVFPEHAVADAAADGEGAEGFEMEHGFFEGPDGVAGVDVGADVAFAGGFDEGFEFVGLHVAGVIFDGDLDAFAFGFGLAGFDGFDDFLDVLLDASIGAAVFLIAEVAACDGGAEGLGDADGEAEVLFGCAVDVLPGIGGFADAAGADVEFQSGAIGLCFEAFEVGFFEVLEHMEFGDEHGVELQGGGVVDELRGLPAGGADGEVIEAEGEFGAGGSLGERGGSGGGEGLREEGAAVHAAHASGGVWAVDGESRYAAWRPKPAEAGTTIRRGGSRTG